VKIKVKRQMFNGKSALTIFLGDRTKKIKNKVETMKALEKQQLA
jgi:23S rRNA maturation-related 3'-5' exoribonuclease YhaM